MSEEGKNSVFEGAEVWCCFEDNSLWEKAVVRNIGHISEIGGKIDVHVEINGERKIIKTKYEEDSVNEYRHIKPRLTVSYEEMEDMDLPALPIVNEPEVYDCMRHCHAQFIQYLSIGPLLIWINRFDNPVDKFNDKLYMSYHFVDDERNDILNPCKASVINVVHKKLLKLRLGCPNKERANQAIVMLGESGSGKSKAVRDLCNHIIYIAGKLHKKPLRKNQFQPDVKFFNHINIILESFGHCETSRNKSSSRFSKSVKMTFDEESGHLTGLLYRCFHLELTRVTTQASKESNYKVFYDIFDDIYFAAQADSRFGIDNMTMLRLTHTRPTIPFLPGRSSFKDLSNALNEVAGITRAQQNVVFGVLAGILHLGEVEMEEADTYGDLHIVLSSDPASVDHMNKALKMLGITLEALLGVISKRKLNFAGSVVEKNLDMNESLAARDSFICQIYGALFRVIVSKINEGIATKFSEGQEDHDDSPLCRREPTATTDSEKLDSDFFEDDVDSARNVFSIYDVVGFENMEVNTLEQLCTNYSNERIFQHLNQMVYVMDKEAFFAEGIFVNSTSFCDNTMTIRLIDSKSNGIFTICDDQLKLKSSTSDEKLSSILYAQHSNNKMFIAGRTEAKNCEFIIKHFAEDVRYQIDGFTSNNKIGPLQEVLDCLQSSSIPFVQTELSSFCDIRSLSATASHLTGLSPKPSAELAASLASQRSCRNLGLERSPSARGSNAFQSPSLPLHPLDTSPPSALGQFNRRDIFQRAASVSTSRPSLSGSSVGGRGGQMNSRGSLGKVSKPITLTSLMVLNMTEVITEVKAAQTTYHLCIRPNLSATYPMNFDQQVVLRQIRPYGLVNILAFYKQTYPHRSDHVSFVNRFSPLAVFCKNSHDDSRDFMTSLLAVRSLGLQDAPKKEWKELAKALRNLLPDVPELERLQVVLSGSSNSVADPLGGVKNGIRVCDNFVMMSGVSYMYLNRARVMAIKLIGMTIWRLYKARRDGIVRESSAVIGAVVMQHLARKKAEAKHKLEMVIKMQAMVRRYIIRRRRFQGKLFVDVNEDVSIAERLVKAQALWRGSFTRKRLALAKLQKEGSGFSIDEGSMPPDDEEMDNNSLEPINMEGPIPPSPLEVAPDDHIQVSNIVTDWMRMGSSTSVANGQTGSRMARIRELQAIIEALEMENSRLKRELQVANADEEDFKVKAYEDDDASHPKLVSKQSSVGSYTPNSLYGGDVESPYVVHSPDKKPRQYEMYVSRTLKALEDDLAYLLQPTPFYKFGRNGRVRKTTLVVSPDFQFLSWKPSTGLLKSSKDCRVDLRLVWRLVAGQSTPPFETYKGVSHGPMPPSRSFSLIYGFRSLDLCACSDESYDDWFTGLRYILQLFNGDLPEAGLDRQLLRRKWNFLDTKGYGFLSRKGVIQLVSSMGIRFDRASFTAALLRSTIGDSTHDEITFCQFDSLVYQLRRRPDLEILWGKILVGHDFSKDVVPLLLDEDFDAAILHEVIGIPAFKQFWKICQGRALSTEETCLMIAEGMGEMHQSDFPVLSYVGFQNIMSHSKNDAYNPLSTMLSLKDMSHPLQHYYIATSDGASSFLSENVDPDDDDELPVPNMRPNRFATAILAGCRALELRCYEERVNARGLDTDLYIGRDRGDFRTTFKETLLHIHRVAFNISPFPLILLLEINADLPQQKRAAKLLKKVFKDAIYTPAEVQGNILPSPNELRHRVIIFLTHRKRDIHSAYGAENKLNSSVLSLSMGEFGESFLSKSPASGKYNGLDDGIGDVIVLDDNMVQYDDDDDDEGKGERVDASAEYPLHTASGCDFLGERRDYKLVDPESRFKRGGTLEDQSQLDVLAKCQGIYPSLMRLCHYSPGLRIGSHGIVDLLAKIDENPDVVDALVKFNMKRFSYIYVDRTTRSFGTYGGMATAWDCGVSLVSVCLDEPSLGTKINHGRFRSNGMCGYVMKHIRYRSPGEYVPPHPSILTIHVISGRALAHNPPKLRDGFNSPLNLSMESVNHSHDHGALESELSHGVRRAKDKGYYVLIDVNGMCCEDIQQKTRTIKKHGSHPFWNEVFSFSLKDSKAGQITLRVFSNDVCTGFVSIPLAHLRGGYRSLQLYQEKETTDHIAEQMEMSSLFVRVKFDSLHDFNAYSEGDPPAHAEPDNLKSGSDKMTSDMPEEHEKTRRHTDVHRSPSRPSEKHYLQRSSHEAVSEPLTSFHLSPSRDSAAPYRRSSSRDDKYRRRSSRDHSDKYHHTGSRGDDKYRHRDLEHGHSGEYRRRSSRDHSDKYRHTGSHGDDKYRHRGLEHGHSGEYRRSTSRDRDSRHSSEYVRGRSHSDKDRIRRQSSSRDNNKYHRYSSRDDSDKEYHSPSGDDLKRETDLDSSNYQPSSVVVDGSWHSSGNRRNEDMDQQALPSVEEHDAEHLIEDDDEAGRGVVETTYETSSPVKLELDELRNGSHNSPRTGNDSMMYGVDRVVSKVDYSSDTAGEDGEDPWTPPV